MKRHWPLLLCCVLATLTAGSAASEDLRPGIIGKDDRVPIANDGPPWNAIGQVNVGSYRTRSECTGTLIAPNLVLTAAHCVVDRRSKAPFPLHTIYFAAAVRRSEIKAHSTAKCVRFLKGYEIVDPRTIASERSDRKAPPIALLKDAAVIVLNDALGIEPVALGDAAAARPGLSLIHAAYPADRRYVLSAHDNCHLLGSPEGAHLWFTDCDTHPASSGGPIFMRTGDKIELVAIMIATGWHQANIALPISQWSELASGPECP